MSWWRKGRKGHLLQNAIIPEKAQPKRLVSAPMEQHEAELERNRFPSKSNGNPPLLQLVTTVRSHALSFQKRFCIDQEEASSGTRAALLGYVFFCLPENHGSYSLRLRAEKQISGKKKKKKGRLFLAWRLSHLHSVRLSVNCVSGSSPEQDQSPIPALSFLFPPPPPGPLTKVAFSR